MRLSRPRVAASWSPLIGLGNQPVHNNVADKIRFEHLMICFSKSL